MTPFDLHIMALTIIGEAASESDEGKAAVAWVIRTRYEQRHNEGRRWGYDLAAVCLMPKQFSVWNDDYRHRLLRTWNYKGQVDMNLYEHCLYIATGVMSSDIPDPTKGADHYFADYIDPPSWADENRLTVQIGRHKFYRLRG